MWSGKASGVLGDFPENPAEVVEPGERLPRRKVQPDDWPVIQTALAVPHEAFQKRPDSDSAIEEDISVASSTGIPIADVSKVR